MTLEEYGKLLSFDNNKNIYYKEVDEYLIYLKKWKYLIYEISSFYIALNEELKKEDKKKFEVAALNNACAYDSLGKKNNVLVITLPEGKKDSDDYVKKCDEIITRVIKLLKALSYTPLKTCPVCHKEGNIDKFFDNLVPIHEECILKTKQELENEISKSSSSKKILAIVLSIFMGLVGVIPALLCAIYLYDYFSLILLLCPLFMVLTYFFMKVEVDKKSRISLFVASFIIIGTFLCIMIPYMAKNNDVTLLEYYFSNGLVGLRKTIIGLLFMFTPLGGMKFISIYRPNLQAKLDLLKK